MIFIAHRINTLSELKSVPKEYGVEIDLRDFGVELVLQHDPFLGGERFEEYLKDFGHRLLLINVKSERTELKAREILKKRKIENYFFLDSSFPMIFKLTQEGEKKIALRFSEFEGVENVLALAGKAEWVWIDCLTRLPLTHSAYLKMKEAGFKLCLVSPCLLGRGEEIESYKTKLAEEGMVVDAVCAKKNNIARWRE